MEEVADCVLPGCWIVVDCCGYQCLVVWQGARCEEWAAANFC